VQESPWPIVCSLFVFQLALSIVSYFHCLVSGLFLIFAIFQLSYFISRWFWDIVVEATFEGHHTIKVQKGLRIGMTLFIISEIMFFFSFFWAFFHSSLSPSIWIGGVWPPHGILTLDPFGLPLLNTVILLTSGLSITFSHRALVCGDRHNSLLGLFITVLLGIIFTLFQYIEYATAPFGIRDGIYGSIFYMTTGFHGLHVIFGTIFLIVCFLRHLFYHFTVEHHFGFEAAAWYWHFVDVVWIFLYLTIYCWGS